MITIKEAVIVEGKYDKIKLSQFIDGLILTTEGFGVFKNREKQQLIRHLATVRGLLVLTDSDGAFSRALCRLNRSNTPIFPMYSARKSEKQPLPKKAN